MRSLRGKIKINNLFDFRCSDCVSSTRACTTRRVLPLDVSYFFPVYCLLSLTLRVRVISHRRTAPLARRHITGVRSYTIQGDSFRFSAVSRFPPVRREGDGPRLTAFHVCLARSRRILKVKYCSLVIYTIGNFSFRYRFYSANVRPRKTFKAAPIVKAAASPVVPALPLFPRTWRV